MADDDGELSVWCRVEVSPLGTYMLVITYDDDNVLSLGRDELLNYVAVMSDALARARYTEGVRRQLRDQFKFSESVVMLTLTQLRKTWPDLPRFGPYEIRPCVSFEGRTSVDVWRGDKQLAQFDAGMLAEHISQTLIAYAGADLDAAYRRFLVGEVGISDGEARLCVTTLNRHLREE